MEEENGVCVKDRKSFKSIRKPQGGQPGLHACGEGGNLWVYRKKRGGKDHVYADGGRTCSPVGGFHGTVWLQGSGKTEDSKLNRENNITILISSHILGELSKIATHYGIIRQGELIEEFDAAELTVRCRRCQKIVVDDASLAANILEEKLHIKEFDVSEKNVVRVFENLSRAGEINRELVLGGVNIAESFLAGQDLEGYFMELLGDERNGRVQG